MPMHFMCGICELCIISDDHTGSNSFQGTRRFTLFGQQIIFSVKRLFEEDKS